MKTVAPISKSDGVIHSLISSSDNSNTDVGKCAKKEIERERHSKERDTYLMSFTLAMISGIQCSCYSD